MIYLLLGHSQISHDVKGRKIIEPDHVNLTVGVFFDMLLYLRNKLVRVFEKQRLLLFQGPVREGRREDLALTSMVHISSLQQAGVAVQCLAIS